MTKNNAKCKFDTCPQLRLPCGPKGYGDLHMKGAIFDVDGTLLNSMGAWFTATERFFKENNIKYNDDTINEFKEMTLDESLPKIKEDNNLSMPVEDIFNWFIKTVEREYETAIPAKIGACEYLKKLRGMGIKIALATSGYEHTCKAAFTRLGVWEYIDACAFSSEVGVNKSNPDVYLLAAERLGLSPRDCVVYEDIVLGVNGAKKGGFKTCAVMDASNLSQWEELKKAADMYIKDFTELL